MGQIYKQQQSKGKDSTWINTSIEGTYIKNI